MTRALFSLLAAGLLLSTGLAAEKVYTPPEPGSNQALVPTLRNDWLPRVQSNFDRTQGKQFDLVFDGDSITDNWQGPGREVWAAHYAKLNATDFGIGGDKVEHVLWRLEQGQLDGINPKLVVLMIGTNNMGRDTADQIAAGIKNLVAEYLKRAPHARILLLGIFPRSEKATDPIRAKIQQVNTSIASLDDGGKRVTYLDFGAKFLSPDGTLTHEIMPDLLHPSAQGYQIWADAIQGEIDKTFPPAK